jgi:hypothetical protein
LGQRSEYGSALTAEHDVRSLRIFSVGFHDSEIRAVYPGKKDALTSVKQLEASAGWLREVPGGR